MLVRLDQIYSIWRQISQLILFTDGVKNEIEEEFKRNSASSHKLWAEGKCPKNWKLQIPLYCFSQNLSAETDLDNKQYRNTEASLTSGEWSELAPPVWLKILIERIISLR